MESTSVLASVLSSIGSVVTSAIGWMSSFLGSITATGHELLLLFIIIPLVGLGVGLLRRLMNVQ